MPCRAAARLGRRARAGALACAVLLLWVAPAGAQRDAREPSSRRWTVSVDVSAEAGAVPRSLLDACVPDSRPGHHPGVGGGVGAAVSRGALSVELRSTAVSTPLVEFPCATVHRSGTHESRRPGFDPGDFVSSELRLRLVLPAAARWSVYAGGGRTWPHHVSLLTVGVGYRPALRSARRIPWVDVGWTRYRVPIRVRVQEWEAFRAVRDISSEVQERWEDGIAARLGLSFPLP